jgi:CheY-like chemotaxis protein
LDLVPSFKPDIVLADIEMPKMNGYQLCEKLKQDPSTSNVPVILLTGAFEPIDEELSKHVGADDYIVKPFESQELISKINAALTLSVTTAEEGEEGLVEAEAVGTEEPAVEEDLWSMEEMEEISGPEEPTGWPAEEEGGAGTEELIEFAEETEETSVAAAEPPAMTKKMTPEVKSGIPEVEFPSKDEIGKMFEEKISSFLSSIDLKEEILAAMTPFLKDSVEKILWEVAPDLVERMLKDMLKGALESLTKEVEKVLWETVPDLAETMISKEIERIRSEF